MPDQNKTKTKQDDSKPQPQQSYLPAGSKIVRADPLDALKNPHPEQGDKPQPAQDADKRQPQEETAQPNRRIEMLSILLTLFFSCVVAISEGFSSYYARKQWVAVTQSLEDAKETRRIENRAYVGVHSVNFDLNVGQITVMLENVGKLPADDVKVVGANMLREVGGIYKSTDYPPFDAGHTKLFPGNFKLQVPFTIENFRPQEAEMILKGRESLMFAGKIQYGDGFGNTEPTEFAFKYLPPPANKWEAIPIMTHAEMRGMK